MNDTKRLTLALVVAAVARGCFGAFIPIGIRIGLDAKERIKAEARGQAPCPSIADGVMLATNASPGQGTLVINRPGAASGRA